MSSDGHWAVVSNVGLNGTLGFPATSSAGNPGRHDRGQVVLFRIEDGVAKPVNSVPGGQAAQGIVFGKDNKSVLVQFDVEKAVAVYEIRGGELVDTGQRLRLEAGPVSIRSVPR